MYCVGHLVNMMLGSPTLKVLQNIGYKILFQVSHENGDWLNENLSRETIFLATTLNDNYYDYDQQAF